mmetsp:Transcript_58327/g.68118  ORF Transcript_58327/g.68118 Transcript_58327/m.68118 type:complete len:106 (-) Transcript_58327:405-722(-)
MLARWRHNEMMIVLTTRPTSHHFEEGKLDGDEGMFRVIDGSYDEFEMETNSSVPYRSSSTNNISGFSPSLLPAGLSHGISPYLGSLGPLPRCCIAKPRCSSCRKK